MRCGIARSLSQAACPYDNAVSESTYRAFKLEFVNQETFHSLKELTFKTKDYVYWWNHHRIHSSLNYQTPIAKRISALKKTLYKFCIEKCCLFISHFLLKALTDLTNGRKEPKKAES